MSRRPTATRSKRRSHSSLDLHWEQSQTLRLRLRQADWPFFIEPPSYYLLDVDLPHRVGHQQHEPPAVQHPPSSTSYQLPRQELCYLKLHDATTSSSPVPSPSPSPYPLINTHQDASLVRAHPRPIHHHLSQTPTTLTSTHRYQARLASRPLLTQAVTTAVLFGAGDVIAQQAVDKKGIEKHDVARTGRMALYGGG